MAGELGLKPRPTILGTVMLSITPFSYKGSNRSRTY